MKVHPTTCGYLTKETPYCNFTPEGGLTALKTCGMLVPGDGQFCFAEGPPNILKLWSQDIPRARVPDAKNHILDIQPGKYRREMSSEELEELKAGLKTNIPFRVIHEDRIYAVPGGLLIELLAEISHLKEALDICKEAAEP